MLTIVPELEDAIANSPPCATTIRLEIANPKPVPEGFVEQNGVII
jgi:hypothetical protein